MSPDLRRAASAVAVIEGPAPPGFQLMGEVIGVSCRRKVWAGGGSMAGAIQDLKFAAAARGATLVTSVVCQNEGTSFEENCWRFFRCFGDAARPIAAQLPPPVAPQPSPVPPPPAAPAPPPAQQTTPSIPPG